MYIVNLPRNMFIFVIMWSDVNSLPWAATRHAPFDFPIGKGWTYYNYLFNWIDLGNPNEVR